MKTCTSCKETKELSEFGKQSKSKDGFMYICKVCNTKKASVWNKNNKERLNKRARDNGYNKKESKKKYSILYKYGITLEDYDNILEKQNNVCAICETYNLFGEQKRMHIDHCHTSGKIRGILCQSCNTALGKFKDNVEYLEKAIIYLKKASNGN